MLSITNSLLAMTCLFNAGLAIFILRDNLKKTTNLLFGSFLCALSFWAVALIGFQTSVDPFTLYYAKTTYLAALYISTSFYLFSLYFPENNKTPNNVHVVGIFAIPALYALVLFSDPTFLIQSITYNEWGRGVVLSIPEYAIFAGIFTSLFTGALIRLWRKYLRAQGGAKIQLLVIALSVSVAGIAGVYYNLILASPYLSNFKYLWTGPLFTTFIAIMVMYSVFRLKLFNAKVIVTEFFLALLWISTLLRTLLASNRQDQLFNGILFALSLVIGLLLIRSVRGEVRARELIEKQELELEAVNKQQENLLHFISHEIKGYLTKSEAGFSAIAEGDFGTVSPELKDMASTALTEVRKGVRTVMDILDASNLKRGTVSYKKKEFDLRDVVTYVVDHLKPAIEEKHLVAEMHIAWELPCKVIGDEEKIRDHVIRNLIDNAIKYTPQGSFKVSVVRKGPIVQFSVQDSGVGITEEDKKRLFTEGGHGKDSIKVNVHSTGYGLYIAKTIIDAHGGRIWAESDGAGKGSRFVVELPALG